MVQLNIAQFQKNKNQLNNVKLISFQEMLGTGRSHTGMQLHASRFAEILGMGMSQAGMRLHTSCFAEMLGVGWINYGLDWRWKLPRVRGILLHPAKPMAWINCGLDQR